MRWIQNVILIILLIGVVPAVFAIDVDIVGTDPAPVTAGDYADITLRFEIDIQGSEQSDVTVGIEETSFIRPLDTDGEFLGYVDDGQTFTRTFRVYFSDELKQGNIQLPVFVNTEFGMQEFKLSLFIQEAEQFPELHVGEVSSTPSELLPDTDDNEITITMLNLGDKDADLVSATLVSQSAQIKPSYSYSMQDQVAEIEAGSSTDLSFTIDIEGDARGQIPATLKLTYRAQSAAGDTFDTFSKEIPFTIDMVEAPFLEVHEYTQLDSFRIGTTENRISVRIQNNGDAEAEEVRVRVIPDISYPFSFETLAEYVASKIQPGESAGIVFKAEVLGDADVREYPITVQIESLVGETRYTREDSIAITTEAGGNLSTQAVGGLVIAAIIAVAAIFAGIRVWNRRKK